MDLIRGAAVWSLDDDSMDKRGDVGSWYVIYTYIYIYIYIYAHGVLYKYIYLSMCSWYPPHLHITTHTICLLWLPRSCLVVIRRWRSECRTPGASTKRHCTHMPVLLASPPPLFPPCERVHSISIEQTL